MVQWSLFGWDISVTIAIPGHSCRVNVRISTPLPVRIFLKKSSKARFSFKVTQLANVAPLWMFYLILFHFLLPIGLEPQLTFHIFVHNSSYALFTQYWKKFSWPYIHDSKVSTTVEILMFWPQNGKLLLVSFPSKKLSLHLCHLDQKKWTNVHFSQ